MPVITTIQQLQQYVRVSYTSQQTATIPKMDLADERHLWPILGEDLYTTMLDPVNNDDADYSRLKELCRRAVAPLAIADNMARKNVTISDIGIHSKATENDTPATRWAYLELKSSLYSDGAEAIEGLIKFLIKKADKFDWVNTLMQPGLVIQSGAEFAKYFPLDQPYRVFFSLVPLIAEVQRFYINTAFGDEFITEILALETPDDLQKRALLLLRSSVANLAIMKATVKLPVKLTKQGLTVLIGDSYDQPYRGDQNAPSAEKQALMQKSEEDGLRSIGELRDFLNKNADQFPGYKNSPYYEPPQTDGEDPNEHRRGVVAI